MHPQVKESDCIRCTFYKQTVVDVDEYNVDDVDEYNVIDVDEYNVVDIV